MQAIGIHLDGSTLRWALVQWNGRRLRALSCQTGTDYVKPLYTNPLISGLACSDLVIRSLPFSAPPSKKLQDALILQAQTSLYLKPEETITLAVQHATQQQTTTYSTTASALDAHLEQFKCFQLDPERVGAMPAAFLAFIKWKAPGLHSYFLIDIGQSFSSCLWVEQGVVQKAHDIPLGAHSLKIAFQEDRKKLISLKERDAIDFSSLKSGQYPFLAEGARALRRELSKLLTSFHVQKPLILTGELDPAGPFRDFLWEQLSAIATEEIQLDLLPDERVYARSLGLAADYLLQRKQPLQFRMREKIAPKIWEQLGLRSLGLLLASLLFCSAFYLLGTFWLESREREIFRNVERWAAGQDPELRSTLFSAEDEPQLLVQQWLRIVDKNKKEYPFLMKAPRVAVFLHWLSSHLLLESFRQGGDSISLEEIRYFLESFPHLDALQEPYLTKVELEFKLANPLHARQLHEALLQDEEIVDTTREIEWDVLSDRYRTSFYLKNGSYGVL